MIGVPRIQVRIGNRNRSVVLYPVKVDESLPRSAAIATEFGLLIIAGGVGIADDGNYKFSCLVLSFSDVNGPRWKPPRGAPEESRSRR